MLRERCGHVSLVRVIWFSRCWERCGNRECPRAALSSALKLTEKEASCGLGGISHPESF